MIAIGNRPGPSRVNHLSIKDGGTVLMIRQTLADWASELPYELSIDRLNGPEPAPFPTDDDQAQQLIRRLGVVIEHSMHGLQPPIFRQPANVIPPPGAPGDKPGYLVAQRNTLGHFRLDDDEALVLVISTGGAGYAAVAAPNVWGVTSDSARHRNSVNNHQAQLDADGRFTVVVANTDPGVANWLDPGGLPEGILMLRWQVLTDDPVARELPGVTARTVALDDLATVLPDTASRVSVGWRQQQAAERRHDYTRRFRSR